MFSRLLLVVLCCLFCGKEVWALENVSEAQLKEVSEQRAWRTLLHYHQQGLLGREYSEVDGEDFFLAENGKFDPLAELKATVTAFMQETDGDKSPQCRFPARYEYLKKQFPALSFYRSVCPTFDEWFAQVKGSKLNLIFPSSYINSPSSMYGHTLLRLDGKQGHNLLSYAINFAAYTDPGDDELTYSIKGLTGGYPGYVSLMPYYEKVNEYSHIESRDIWEYELNLSQEKIDKFVRHIWELDKIRFDYFFIDENCSYRLLTLLDAVDSELHLADQFKYRTVPSDTLRILFVKNLISKIEFRPSKTTLIEHHRTQMSDALQAISRDLADDPFSMSEDPDYVALASKDKAMALELAYDYSRYLALKKKVADPTLPKRSLKLLSLRAQVPFKGTPFVAPPKPSIRDEQGHDTLRTTFTAGPDYGELGFRLNYHDWMDVLPGYRQGAQIEMGGVSFHIRDDIRLESFDAIHVRSVGQRHKFSHPISWQVKLGYERWISDEEGQSQLRAGGGHSYQFLGGTIYAMGIAQLALADRYDENWRVGYGPEVGYLIQKNRWNAWISGERFASLGTQGASNQLQTTFAFNPSSQQQLRIQWRYHNWQDETEQEVRLSYAIYH